MIDLKSSIENSNNKHTPIHLDHAPRNRLFQFIHFFFFGLLVDYALCRCKLYLVYSFSDIRPQFATTFQFNFRTCVYIRESEQHINILLVQFLW